MGESSVTIVGSNNKPTGGVHRYISNLHEQMPATVDSSVYDVGAPEGSGPVWFLESFLLALLDALRFPLCRPPDVLHVHTAYAFAFVRSSFYVLFGAYVWRRPVVLHVHGSSFDDFVDTDSRLLTWYVRWVLDATDRIIVLGDYWHEVVAEHADPDKLRILPNAVHTERYEPRYDADPARLVYISDLIERKGVAEMVETVETLCGDEDREVRVDLAGRGELADAFEDLDARYDAVTYHGFVSEEKKRQLLNESTIYVLPSYAEGLPIAMLEAMAGGNAVVATTVGSIPEVISAENGRLVEPGDAEALTDAVRSLLDSLAETERVARTNRDLAVEHHSWNEVIDRVVDCYETLVDGSTA